VTVKVICVNGHLLSGATYHIKPTKTNAPSACCWNYRNFRWVGPGPGRRATFLLDLETPCANLIGDINFLT